jgi:hypothetical protein
MTKTGMIAALIAALGVGCNAEPALLTQIKQERLINDIRQALLQSVESEKSAVLATSDEESQSLAQETLRFGRDIDRMRGELRQLTVADGRPQELAKLDDFDRAWAELEAVDERLLALAVANTNAKAALLSAEKGVAALDRFVETLGEMQRSTSQPDLILGLSQASADALRVQPLVMIHIPSRNDAEMTRLEQRIQALRDDVDRRLGDARDSGRLSPEQVATASQAWRDYLEIVTEVLRLSRQNTDVIAFDVSMHEKRDVTKKCLSALAALLAAIRSGPQGTR